MRSSHSSHRSSMSRSHHSSMSHRSSFSHSHRSSITSRNGFGGIRHNSMHRSSFGSSMSSRRHSSLGSMHRSSLNKMHRSTLSNRSTIGTMMSRRSAFKHHGISDAHAFAVGKATGVNINASAMGAHGAALHRSRTIKNARYTKSKRSSGSFAKRKIKFSNNNKYKSKKYKIDPTKNNINIDLNLPMNNYSKFIGIAVIFFMIFFVIMLISMAFSFSSRVQHPFFH